MVYQASKLHNLLLFIRLKYCWARRTSESLHGLECLRSASSVKNFKTSCKLDFSGPSKEKSEGEKISYLLIWTGDEGIELVSTWSMTETEQAKLDTYLTKFEEYVAPQSNFRLARYKFRVLKHEKGKSVNCFIKKVRVFVKVCKYANDDEHIVDALIFGSNDPRVQQNYLSHCYC